MTRLQVIRYLRSGQTLIKYHLPETDGVSVETEVWIRIEDICNFQRRRLYEHEKFGPIHVRFGGWHWVHITPKQLLGYIKRNYPR